MDFCFNSFSAYCVVKILEVLDLVYLQLPLILSVMILPIIISVSQDAIKAVPGEYREAALGLGSTIGQTPVI